MSERAEGIGNARLDEVAAVYGEARIAAELFDAGWNLIWVSDELKTLIGEDDEERLGVGKHVIVGRNRFWLEVVTEETQAEWQRANLGYILHETPAPDLARAVEEAGVGGDAEVVAALDPGPAPPNWSFRMDYRRPGFPPLRINCDSRRIDDVGGERVGTANVYFPALPASVIDLLARGDERMYERMARLVEPGRRAAAILFADLQASGALSRRLPSAVYFRLIRALTTRFDAVVGELGGIVGKHAGDGVTAFFLAADAGSDSSAARAAVEAVRAITAAADQTASEFAADGVGVTPADLRMNIGVHWGGALYMGQIVTGGRLEVTALGDEVNEAARIQQAARDGAAFASKPLIERLEPADATAVGIDPDAAAYRTVAELPGADEKTVRDAGGIAVTALGGDR